MPEEQLPETMNAVTAVNLALRGTEGPVFGPHVHSSGIGTDRAIGARRLGPHRLGSHTGGPNGKHNGRGHRPGRNEAVKNPPNGGRRWRGTD